MSGQPLEITYNSRAEWDAALPREAECLWATKRLLEISKFVKPIPGKPCAYQPWTDAFARAQLHPSVIVGLAERLERHKPQQNTPAASAFIVTFLEEDVMQLRSGYLKQKLIRRLWQSDTAHLHMQRIDQLLRRVVTEGTGQEFRAYCRLAANLQPEGLEDWLRQMAADVILSPFQMDGELYEKCETALTTDEYTRVFRDPRWYPRFGIRPDLAGGPIPMKKANWRAKENMSATNAWKMLQAIKRRQQTPK